MKRRIVVTGFGVKVPNGECNTDFLNHLLSGEHRFTPRNDITPNGDTLYFGEVRGELGTLENKKYRILPRISRLAISTSAEALAMAELDLQEPGNKTGVFFGTTMGGTTPLEEMVHYAAADQFREMPVYCCGLVHYHSLASSISSFFHLNGISKTVTTGCTAGLEALEDAVCYLQSGKINTAIVGAADSSNNKVTVYGFGKIKALPFNQELGCSGSPFNKKSRGFILSEGAASLILETEEHALRRNAIIYGYIDAVATNNDAESVNGQDRTGRMMKQAVQEVLGGRIPDYYNSQALGYEQSDSVEDIVSRDIFHHKVPLTSIKGLTGHPFSVSGLAQLIASILGFQHHFIPKTIRTDQLGYEHLPLIREENCSASSEVLITSHGYGGNNACVYLTKV